MHGSESADEVTDLCHRCGEGDEDAFSEVYRRFGGALYASAWRILRSPQEAEEVVQETFLTLYRKGVEAQPRNLGAWLHRVAANRALDRIRSRKRRAEVELREELRGAPAASAHDPVVSTHAATGDSEAVGYTLGVDLERAVERLPERMRIVFLLHDVEGFKHREIGEIMEISDGSSKSQLFHARAMLRDWLDSGRATK